MKTMMERALAMLLAVLLTEVSFGQGIITRPVKKQNTTTQPQQQTNRPQKKPQQTPIQSKQLRMQLTARRLFFITWCDFSNVA